MRGGEARAFYAALQGPVRVGIEATGYTHWFEAILAELAGGPLKPLFGLSGAFRRA